MPTSLDYALNVLREELIDSEFRLVRLRQEQGDRGQVLEGTPEGEVLGAVCVHNIASLKRAIDMLQRLEGVASHLLRDPDVIAWAILRRSDAKAAGVKQLTDENVKYHIGTTMVEVGRRMLRMLACAQDNGEA